MECKAVLRQMEMEGAPALEAAMERQTGMRNEQRAKGA